MPAILLLFAALAAVNVEGNPDCKLDLLFLVDGSSTICNGKPPDNCPNWKANLRFINTIVSSLTIGPDNTKVAFVKYGNEAVVRWNLNQHTDKKSLINAIDSETLPGGELSSTDSFEVVLTDVYNNETIGDRPGVFNVAIMITDDVNVTHAVAVATSKKLQEAAHAKMLVVCVTERCSEDCAKAVSSYPNARGVTYFMAKKYSLIETVRKSLLDHLCEKYDEEKR